jgi:hypothetical protein
MGCLSRHWFGVEISCVRVSTLHFVQAWSQVGVDNSVLVDVTGIGKYVHGKLDMSLRL